MLNNKNNDVKSSKKARINAFISRKNYEGIDVLMNEGELISMRLSKGAILDLALTHLFKSLEIGETLENIAIQHLEIIADNKEGDF